MENMVAQRSIFAFDVYVQEKTMEKIWPNKTIRNRFEKKLGGSLRTFQTPLTNIDNFPCQMNVFGFIRPTDFIVWF